MTFASGIAHAIDRVYGVVSPRAALERVHARHQFEMALRMYAAAKPTADAGGWLPLDGGPNSAIRTSAPTVRARIRQLVRDFPYFARAVNVSCAFVVGPGIRFQARLYKPNGKLDRPACTRLEEGWERWADKADTSGRLCFAELMELAERQRLECGEYFFVKRYIKRRFCLQPLEPDRLTSLGATPAAGCDVEQGVEFEIATGRPVAYWVQDDAFTPDGPLSSRYSLRTKRVPADQMIHGYKPLRPGQMRGISPLVSCVMVAGDLADLLDSELTATRVQSKYLGFVTAANPAEFQASRQNGRGSGGKDKGPRREYLESATLEYLRQGEKIELAQLNRQTQTFEPFLQFNLRTLAVVSGITAELLTGKYDGISYSNLRGIRQDLKTTLAPVQRDIIRQLCRPVFSAWFDWSRLAEPSLLPYPRCLDPWESQWIAPGQEPVDPLKEIKAFADELALGVRSPQEWAAARGRDFEEVLDEIQAAREMSAARGLDLGKASGSSKTNPAALMSSDNKES